MVKLKYFYNGFIGVMQEKHFNNKEAVKEFLEENVKEINATTVTIEHI